MVMRRAERAHAQQTFARWKNARDAVNLGGFDCFAESERRKDARESLGQHGLPRARGADHEYVVAAGRRHLERTFGCSLPAHIPEIRSRVLHRRRRRHAVRLHGLEFPWTIHQGHHLGERPYSENADSFYHRSFGCILGREH